MEYINKGNKATKAGFGEGVLAAAQKDERVVGLGADITASVGMNLFKEAFPERFFSMGIAEQDAVAVASGMALSGKIPVCPSLEEFSTVCCDSRSQRLWRSQQSRSRCFSGTLLLFQ